jgi:hypothetical protein
LTRFSHTPLLHSCVHVAPKRVIRAALHQEFGALRHDTLPPLHGTCVGCRYFDGTYAPGGVFFKALDAAARPVFGTKTANPLLFLVLVSGALLVYRMPILGVVVPVFRYVGRAAQRHPLADLGFLSEY